MSYFDYFVGPIAPSLQTKFWPSYLTPHSSMIRNPFNKECKSAELTAHTFYRQSQSYDRQILVFQKFMRVSEMHTNKCGGVAY